MNTQLKWWVRANFKNTFVLSLLNSFLVLIYSRTSSIQMCHSCRKNAPPKMAAFGKAPSWARLQLVSEGLMQSEGENTGHRARTASAARKGRPPSQGGGNSGWLWWAGRSPTPILFRKPPGFLCSNIPGVHKPISVHCEHCIPRKHKYLVLQMKKIKVWGMYWLAFLLLGWNTWHLQFTGRPICVVHVFRACSARTMVS